MNTACRSAAGVGIIGKDGDPANRMYFGVLAVGLIGAGIARFRPRAMTRGPLELSLPHGFFVALFALSGGLFRRAAGGRPEPRAV